MGSVDLGYYVLVTRRLPALHGGEADLSRFAQEVPLAAAHVHAASVAPLASLQKITQKIVPEPA
jgi:hypothetical protein